MRNDVFSAILTSRAPKLVGGSLCSHWFSVTRMLRPSDPPPIKRGVPRPQGSTFDIGAFELEQATPDTTAPTILMTYWCDGGALLDDVEQTLTVGNSSLSYDATSSTYSYNWKADKAWVGTCRQLIIKLNDGTEHKANFKLK